MEVEEFLEHHGIKGMKWGSRRSSGRTSSEPIYSKEEAKAHNAITDNLDAKIKTATHEHHMERIIDTAYLNGHVEGNMKVHNVSMSDKKDKLNYEISLHRVTAGKPSTHPGDGGKRQHVYKEVHRDPRPGMSALDHPEWFGHFDVSISEFLAHHGIKGMKWGVHRFGRSSGGSSASRQVKSGGKPPWHSPPVKKAAPAAHPSGATHTPHTKAQDQLTFEHLKIKAKNGGIHSLSNEEIRVLTTRAEALKKAYATFPKKKTKKQALAKFVIDDLLIKSGKKTLQNITDEQMKQLGIKRGLISAKSANNSNNNP